MRENVWKNKRGWNNFSLELRKFKEINLISICNFCVIFQEDYRRGGKKESIDEENSGKKIEILGTDVS